MYHSILRFCRLAAFQHIVAMVLITGAGFAVAGERPLKSDEIKPDAIYHNYCSVCHGDRGDGRSRASNSLMPAPRDFTTASELTRDTMITIVTHGKPTTAMVGWTTQLNAKEIEAVVDYIRQTFMALALDPRLQHGKVVYTENCLRCHGDRGQGLNDATTGAPAPKDLTSPQMRVELSRERMIKSVATQHHGSVASGFAGKLSTAEIEEVVDYVSAGLMIPASSAISGVRAREARRSDGQAVASPSGQSSKIQTIDMQLQLPKELVGNAKRGGEFFKENCATCHGARGDGKGSRAAGLNPKPRNFLDAASRSQLNRPAIYAAVYDGKTGTEMPAWGKVLNEQQVADVSEYVFQQFVRTGKK
ncbi:MAG: c-type cytochrome [Rhodoferax sp.]|nr:c-type cytochrome [Rhodoferax sp.]